MLLTTNCVTPIIKMNTVKIIILSPIICLGTFIILANWFMIFLNLRGKRFHSLIPLVGPLLLTIPFLLIQGLRPYVWLPFLIDPGTVVLFMFIPRMVSELWSTSRFRLRSEYVGVQGRMTCRLKLFKKEIFTMEQSIQLARGEVGLVSRGRIGRWRREEGRLILEENKTTAILESLPGGDGERLRVTSVSPEIDVDSELSIAGLELVAKRAKKS